MAGSRNVERIRGAGLRGPRSESYAGANGIRIGLARRTFCPGAGRWRQAANMKSTVDPWRDHGARERASVSGRFSGPSTSSIANDVLFGVFSLCIQGTTSRIRRRGVGCGPSNSPVTLPHSRLRHEKFPIEARMSRSAYRHAKTCR